MGKLLMTRYHGSVPVPLGIFSNRFGDGYGYRSGDGSGLGDGSGDGSGLGDGSGYAYGS